MKKTFLCLSTVLAVLLVGGISIAQEDIPVVPLVAPINPALIDIVGTWSYTASASSVTGPCPSGPASSGTATNSGGAGGYTLVFISGMVCSPSSMCTYAGTLSGNSLVVSNTAVVDDEGGSATNALGLTVYTNGHISGDGSSRYVHHEGFECHWRYTITLTRGKPGR
jgi:hypothetical protein